MQLLTKQTFRTVHIVQNQRSLHSDISRLQLVMLNKHGTCFLDELQVQNLERLCLTIAKGAMTQVRGQYLLKSQTTKVSIMFYRLTL